MAQRLREAFARWAGGVFLVLVAAFWGHASLEKRAETMRAVSAGAGSPAKASDDESVRAVVHQPAMADEDHGGIPRALAQALSGAIAVNASQIAALYESWGRRDGEAAVGDALARRIEMGNGDALTAAFRGWIVRDREAAMWWAENASMGLWRRRECTKAVLRALPEPEAEARGAWVARFPRDEALITEFAYGWAEREPERAARWLMQLDDGSGKFAALSAVVGLWADDDPDIASRFIADLPAGDGRDHAIAAFVEAIAELDPETAGVWVRTISNPAIRKRASGLTGIDPTEGELISGPRAPHVSRKPGR